jgi:hypothetical protein
VESEILPSAVEKTRKLLANLERDRAELTAPLASTSPISEAQQREGAAVYDSVIRTARRLLDSLEDHA